MKKIRAVFRNTQKSGIPAIIGYLPTGFPKAQTYLEIVKTATSAGLHILELGLPVAMPVLDGQVIQNALHTIQENGIDINQGLTIGAQALEHTGCTGIAMFYAEALDTFGSQQLLEKCKSLNIAGVLPIGMSSKRWLSFADLAHQNDVAVVSFIEWGYDDATILAMLEKTTGFTYVQSSQGATGRKVLFGEAVKNRLEKIQHLAAPLEVPVAVGFGIQNAADVEKLHQLGVDGVIVGTALVEAAAKGNEQVHTLITALSNSTSQEKI